ncbi:MAG: hypothetical protein IT179_21700 [Acidobacteria bacterium]|nr:hypothetical protein [Acidobacteriota bacterium]
MMVRLAGSTAWMLAGGAAFGATFWAFLNTPESTIFTLALSLVLVLAMYAVMAVTWSGAVLGWAHGWSGTTARRALAGLPRVLPPLLLVGLAWWLVGRGLEWIDAHAGEISAWFIATLDSPDVRWLLNGAGYVGEWVRRLAIPFAGLAWLGHLLLRGWHPLFDRACLAHAFSPVRLLLATLIAGATIHAPVRYGLYWVPPGLPATWVEPAFATLKFGAIAVIGAVGASLIARLAVKD